MGDSLNPYAPPREAAAGAAAALGGYSPLGWETTAASGGVVANVLFTLLMGVAVMAMPNPANGPPRGEALVLVLAIGVVGLGAMASSIFAIVMFLVWQFNATKNVRAFGRYGLNVTPTWAVVA